jgi:hypothetical protein
MSLLTQLGINLITHGFGGDYSTYASELSEEEYQYIRRHRLTRNGRSSSNKNLKQFTQVYVGLMQNNETNKHGVKRIEYVKSRLPRVHASLKETLIREGLRGDAFDVELNINEWKFLTFTVTVDATDKTDVTYEFVIQQDDDTKLAFRGVPTPDGVVVRIPPLKNKIEDGIYIASLRVFTDTHVFTPLMIRISIKDDAINPALKECINMMLNNNHSNKRTLLT